MNKPLHQIHSVRLQRIRLKLNKYFLTVVYVPGKELHIADALSRSFSETNAEEMEELNQMVHTLSASEEQANEIVEMTHNDPILKEIIILFRNGWPNDRNQVTECVRYFWKFRNELFVENGIVFFNERIFIPAALRDKMLKKVHEGHFGMNRTVLRAKSVMYWPNMESDINEMVGRCRICEKFQNENRREPMISHEIPSVPFEKIGCDFCDFAGKSYLIIRDYFSKWTEIIETRTKTAEEVISKWRHLFSTFGLPKIIIADNQPFNSLLCIEFSKQNNFKIVTSSPYYARSNGMTERAVQTAKLILRKAGESNLHYSQALLEYHNTPLPEIKVSPSQIVFGRQLRTKLPVAESLLKNRYSNVVHDKLLQLQKRMKLYYDRHTINRIDFADGKMVNIRESNEWHPAKIIRRASDGPRSYILQKSNGRVVRRNKFHIRKLNSNFNVNNRNYDDFEDNFIDSSNSIIPIENQNNVSNLDPESSLDVNLNSDVYHTRSGRVISIPKRYGFSI